MPFELRDHTADVAVAATSDDLEGVFAAVADGLAAATGEAVPAPDDGNGDDDDGDSDDDDGDRDDAGVGNADRFSLSLAAETREALLYDYLADLIYERDVRAVLPVDNDVSIREPMAEDRSETAVSERIDDERIDDDSTDSGSTNGESTADRWHLDASARGVALSAIDAREVKAVTYSEMALEETAEGWRAYVVFDV